MNNFTQANFLPNIISSTTNFQEISNFNTFSKIIQETPNLQISSGSSKFFVLSKIKETLNLQLLPGSSDSTYPSIQETSNSQISPGCSNFLVPPIDNSRNSKFKISRIFRLTFFIKCYSGKSKLSNFIRTVNNHTLQKLRQHKRRCESKFKKEPTDENKNIKKIQK